MTTTAGRQIGHLWSAEVATLVLGAAQGVLVARGLGARGYGVFAVVTTFTTLVFVVLDPRGADAVTKYTSVFLARRDNDALLGLIKGAFLLDLAFGALAAIIAIGSSGLLSVLGVAGDSRTLVAIAAAGAFLGVPSSSGRAALGAFHRFRTIARLQIAVALLRASVIIAVALLFDVRAVFIAFAGLAAIEGSGFLIAAERAATRAVGQSPRAGQLSSLRGHGKEIAGFLAYADAGTLAGSFIKQVDVLAVSAVADSTVAGYYRLAKSLTGPAGNVGGPIQAVIYPRLAEAAAGADSARFAAIFRRTLTRAGLPLAAAALLAIPFCGPVIRLLAGDEFAPAVGLAQILIVGVAISFITLPLRPAYLTLGHDAAFAWNALFTALAASVGFVVLGSSFGAAGIAWSRVLSIALGATILFLWMSRFVRRHGYVPRIGRRPPLEPAVEAGFQPVGHPEERS